MISYLRGSVFAKTTDAIILLAGNIGYKVFLAPPQLSKVLEKQELELFCHLYIRKDETLELYGLFTLESLQLFDIVRGVSGIGPKASLAIASLGTMEEFRTAIQGKNEAFFAGLHGVGRKKIQKIILELTGKLENVAFAGRAKDDESLEALVRLGFSKNEAQHALENVSPNAKDIQQKIREALKLLGKR